MTMTILGSNVRLSSQSTSIAIDEVTESLRMWTGDRRPDFARGGASSSKPGRALGDMVRLADAGRRVDAPRRAARDGDGMGGKDGFTQDMLVHLIELLTGKKIQIKWFSMEGMDAKTARAGFGIEYDRHEIHYESEATHFQAAGIVRTQDGREIAISVDLSMSRELLQEQDVSLRLGDAALKDPLVLDFGGDMTELTATRYAFDIDADGQSDNIPFVGPDSGFLALDRNGNGAIDDGTELFGAGSGQGFADLARYDADGNRWIDANDAIYQSLRIWSKDADGRDRLVGLAALGVGAIYLDHVDTPFSIKDGDSALLGRIAESGVFLREDGTAGAVHQIDLSV